MTPQEIASIDGSPGLSVVQDFCKSTKDFSLDLASSWEPIEEHLLDSLHVPDEPEIVPHKAWRVTQGERQWMIYMWYENSSWDSDTYVYEEVAP
jgi:hypothetical protein